MYDWRKWTPEKQESELERRKWLIRPWHGPPHFSGQQTSQYLIIGTCYEHAPILGSTMERMDAFVSLLYQAFSDVESSIHAWVLLPNHYHVLATTSVLQALTKRLGQLHGSTSFAWNGEDNARGRKCWHRVSDRAMRSEAHFWATVNYIHHNAVKHGYVLKWTDWPWSSAQDFLRDKGRTETLRIWRGYPLENYGAVWDD